VQVVSYCKEITRPDGQRDKILLEHLRQEEIAEEMTRSPIPSPSLLATQQQHYPQLSTRRGAPNSGIPERENTEDSRFLSIRALWMLTDRTATSKDEEHPDINLDLCISLPLHSTPAANKASSVDGTVDSKSYYDHGVCCQIGLQVNYGGC